MTDIKQIVFTYNDTLTDPSFKEGCDHCEVPQTQILTELELELRSMHNMHIYQNEHGLFSAGTNKKTDGTIENRIDF